MVGFVVKQRRSWCRLTVYVAGFVLMIALLLGSADFLGVYQKRDGGWGFSLPWEISQGLSPEELLGENSELREKLLILEQNSKLDKQAAALLQDKLVDSQEEIFQLRKDLEFYQGIITAADDANSPRVHGLRVKPLRRANGYRLELILLNIANTDKMIEGVIDIEFEGIQDSTLKRLSISALSLDESWDYKISFRNFQRFANNFILPENFEPQRVFVTLSPDEPGEPDFGKIFDWPETDMRGES